MADLQHMALERERMEPKYEELFKNAGSMRAVREVVASLESEEERTQLRGQRGLARSVCL